MQPLLCVQTSNQRALIERIWPAAPVIVWTELLNQMAGYSVASEETTRQSIAPLNGFSEIEKEGAIELLTALKANGLSRPEDFLFLIDEAKDRPKIKRLKCLTDFFFSNTQLLDEWDYAHSLLEKIKRTDFRLNDVRLIFLINAFSALVFVEFAQGLSQKSTDGAVCSLSDGSYLQYIEGAATKDSSHTMQVFSSSSTLTNIDAFLNSLTRFQQKHIEPLCMVGLAQREQSYLDLHRPRFHPLPFFELECIQIPSNRPVLTVIDEQACPGHRFPLDRSDTQWLISRGFLPAYYQKHFFIDTYTQWLRTNRGRAFVSGSFQDGKTRAYSFPRISVSNKSLSLEPRRATTAFSNTQLETYLKCPKQYYYKYELSLRDSTTSDALILGRTVHESLFEYLRFPCPGISLKTIATAKLEEALRKTPLDKLSSLHLAQKLHRALQHFETVEARKKEAIPSYVPQRFEQSFEFIYEDVVIRGSFDRLDRSAAGHWLVVDYKTGHLDFTPDDILNLSNTQALVYLLALNHWLSTSEFSQDKPVGIVFYDLKTAELKRGFVQVSSDTIALKKLLSRGHVKEEEEWQTILTEGAQKLKQVFLKIQQREFTAAPSATTCHQCPYYFLCESAYEKLD